MKNFLSNNRLYIMGAIGGAIAGYLYWQEIGCISGTCLITSKPMNSTLYGSAMGALVLGLFKKDLKKQKSNEGES